MRLRKSKSSATTGLNAKRHSSVFSPVQKVALAFKAAMQEVARSLAQRLGGV